MREDDCRPTILLIDDEPINLKIQVRALRDDYRILTANSGAAGLAVAEAETPELILLDIMMPGMDGYEVCERLKERAATQEIPVIFLTALSEWDNEEKGLRLGAIDYLTKPVRLPILRLKIKNHLEMQRQRKLLKALTAELALKNRQLEILARQDDLTGVANRRTFNEKLDQELRRASRCKGPLSLILCDIDFFKAYNDQFGHVAGDECLRRIGALMLRLFRRAGDLATRFGGDEFAVILADTGGEEALEQANALRAAVINEGIKQADNAVADVVTLSIGVVSSEGIEGQTAEWLTAQADEALYRSKKDGRNRVTAIRLPPALRALSSTS